MLCDSSVVFRNSRGVLHDSVAGLCNPVVVASGVALERNAGRGLLIVGGGAGANGGDGRVILEMAGGGDVLVQA